MHCPMNIATGVFRSSSLSAAVQLLVKAIDLGTLVCLARLLDPASFGLVAVAMTIIFITEAILELPISSVLLLHRNVDDDAVATGFTLGLLRALLIAAIAVVAGYVLSLSVRDERVFWLVAVLSLSPCLRGLISPRMVIFAFDQNFKPQARMDLLAKVVASAVAIGGAYFTRSYWAIAAGVVSGPVVMVLYSFYLAPFRLRCSLARWNLFSRYVGWNMASQTIRAINWQLDRVLLPRQVTLEVFGKYAIASDIVAVPVKAFVQPLANPLLAGFSAIDPTDHPRLARAYLFTTDAVLSIVAPVYVLIAIYSDILVPTILGKAWRESSDVVAAMSVIAIISLIPTALGSLSMVCRRPDVMVRLSAVEFVPKVVGMLVLIPILGINGAIVAQFVAAVIASGYCLLLVRFLVQSTLRTQLSAMLLPLSATAAMLLAIASAQLFIVQHLPFSSIGQMVCGIFIGCLSYVTSLVSLWWVCGKPDGLVSLTFRQFRSIRRR